MEENVRKPKKKTLSQLETFGSIAENMEKLFPSGIPKGKFISQMIASGVFTKMQAEIYFDKMHRSGFMYEPRPDFFKIDW